MTRIFGLNVLPEMLGLWLIETSVGYLVFYLLINDSLLFRHRPDGLEASLARAMPAGVHMAAVGDTLLLALTVGLVGLATGLYRPETCVQTRGLLLKTVVSAAVSLPALWLVAAAGGVDLPPLADGWLLPVLLAWTALLFVTRRVYTMALRMDLFVRRVAVLGAPPAVRQTVAAIDGMRRFLYRIEVMPTPGGAGLARLPRGLWGVVLTGPAAPPPPLPPGVRVFDTETFLERQLGRIDLTAAARREATAEGPKAEGMQAAAAVGLGLAPAVRRLLDITLALLLLVLTAPLLLLTAVFIRLEGKGPVFYWQERVGLHGHPFTLWKFRSMAVDAEKLGPIWAAVGDVRVTRVGGVIRRVRIDELPQLLNIVRGEMSLVGPRPERPHFVEQLAGVIPLYRQRCLVRPGLTGWAQVNCPYSASVDDARTKLSYDLYYMKHRSLLFDLLILLASVRVILFQEGAR